MKKLTIREAVIKVLKLKGKPLSSREIYDKIIEQDLYRFNAERPEGIVKVEIRRHCVGVEFPTASPNKYFQILLDGKYWIKDLPVPGQTSSALKAEINIRNDSENLKSIVSELKIIHAKHLDAFRLQILNQLKEIHPKSFENFSKRLLEVYGFLEMRVTNYVKDGGLDGNGQLKVGITNLNVAFQCKRWKTNTVSRTEIDKFRGAIQGAYELGIIFTTSNFSKEALNATRRNGAVPIILIDGPTLVDIMIEKRFGIEFETMPVYINALDNALTEDGPKY